MISLWRNIFWFLEFNFLSLTLPDNLFITDDSSLCRHIALHHICLVSRIVGFGLLHCLNTLSVLVPETWCSTVCSNLRLIGHLSESLTFFHGRESSKLHLSGKFSLVCTILDAAWRILSLRLWNLHWRLELIIMTRLLALSLLLQWAFKLLVKWALKVTLLASLQWTATTHAEQFGSTWEWHSFIYYCWC
jgi:hypothetical protein